MTLPFSFADVGVMVFAAVVTTVGAAAVENVLSPPLLVPASLVATRR